MNNYRNFTFMLCHNIGDTQNEYLQELYNLVSFLAGEGWNYRNFMSILSKSYLYFFVT
jgi:hypothetical protein